MIARILWPQPVRLMNLDYWIAATIVAISYVILMIVELVPTSAQSPANHGMAPRPYGYLTVYLTLQFLTVCLSSMGVYRSGEFSCCTVPTNAESDR
jgi:hypothetical protein